MPLRQSSKGKSIISTIINHQNLNSSTQTNGIVQALLAIWPLNLHLKYISTIKVHLQILKVAL